MARQGCQQYTHGSNVAAQGWNDVELKKVELKKQAVTSSPLL